MGYSLLEALRLLAEPAKVKSGFVIVGVFIGEFATNLFTFVVSAFLEVYLSHFCERERVAGAKLKTKHKVIFGQINIIHALQYHPGEIVKFFIRAIAVEESLAFLKGQTVVLLGMKSLDLIQHYLY